MERRVHGHQFTMMKLLSSALVPLAVTLFVFSEIQVTSANKTVPCDSEGWSGCKDYEFCDKSTGKCTDNCAFIRCRNKCEYGKCVPNDEKPCDKTGCKDDEFCDRDTGKCAPDYGDCKTAPCGGGFYCNDYGKCIKDSPCPPGEEPECPPEQECYLQRVQCFVAPCPPVPSCRPKCDAVKCPDGEMCENGECVLDSRCAVVLCLKGTVCYKGGCFKEVPCEGRCGPVEKCYLGNEECSTPPCPEKVVCRPDKCAVVRCSAGHECVDGQCVSSNGV